MALLEHRQQPQDLAGAVDQRDLLSAATAFFKWRQAALKAGFRRELEGILEEVAQDEEDAEKVKKQLQKAEERLEETSQALSKATSDHRLALVHIDQLHAQNDELFRALEAAEGASRTHAEQARAANIMHQEEAKRRQEESRKSGLEIQGLREQYQSMVAQQQALLDSLAQRDREIAEANQEGLHHKRNAARLQEEVERLEAIARATGERAAAAEAQAAARTESINKIYAELSGLRERYHSELSELKAARMGAAEVQRMKERLDSMQATNDSLVAARDELRASLEGVMAKLTAAEQRLKRQAVAATMRDSIIDTIAQVSRELARDGDESLILQATTRLSSELDLALTNNTDLAERLTSADAVISQQQGHIRRLAEECSSLEAQLRESREHRDAQHRLNAELAAELKRLAAESALGPILALDKDGNLILQEPLRAPPPAATAPATSQLEAQSTAVRVILADKGFGLGALCQAIAANPGSVQSVRAQLGECRALTEALRVDVEEVGALLAVRPFEAEELSRKLPVLQERLSKTETCLVAVREDLTLKQVHAVSLEARMLAAESALRGGSSLLQGWSGLLSQVVAVEDGRLEPDVRLGLREEVKTREDALHRAMLDLAATAPPLLGGDPGYAVAQLAMREACNAMMDLALTLGDRLVDAPATRTRVLATEQLLLDRASHLARFREVLVKSPGEIADMVERLTAVIPDIQAMGPAVEEMLRCVQHYLAAGREPVVDVVALQGEVLMLRGLVRTKDMHIQALEAVGTGIRTGSPAKRAQKMVPLEALHAAERARDTVAGEKAALQTRLVDQRVLLVAARHRLVNYMASLRAACEAAEVFYKWRAAAATIKAERCHADMVTAQKEQARVEQEAREATARMEAEIETMRVSHAAEVASLVATHATEVEALAVAHETKIAAIQTEHVLELERIEKQAREAAETRVKALHRILKEKTARLKELLTFGMLYYWRFRVHRQTEARHRWRDFSLRLRRLEEPENPTYWDIMFGPRMTIARRLALRHQDHSDLRTPQALSGRQIARMVLQAWRSWAYIKRQTQEVDALTESIPTFVENIGDRRRLERAWLALRLWTAGSATRRAHQAIRDYEAATAEAQAAQLAAEAAKAQADAASAVMEEEKLRQAALAEAAAQAGLLLLPAPGQHDVRTMYGGGVSTGQQTDNTNGSPYMLYQLPTMEVGTQYLPNIQTVITGGTQAPEHALAADAVAAARVAGLNVGVQPIATSQHQGSSVAPGTMAVWGELRGPGAMPPVAGPSQAAIDALKLRDRRMLSPDVHDGSRVHGRAASATARGTARARTGRAASSGRLPPSKRGNQRPERGSVRQVGTGARGPVSSAVASLEERAHRLAMAVDAISAGVADTAAMLSPRRRVLQVEADAAGGSGSLEDSIGREVAPSETEMSVERQALGSPTQRFQLDGSVSLEYNLQSSEGGSDPGPPRIPTYADDPTGQLRVSRPDRGPDAGGALDKVPTAGLAQAEQRPRSSSRPSRGRGVAPGGGGGRRTGGAASAAMTTPGATSGRRSQNSIQRLLRGVPGGSRQLREASRTYGHVGSRLHDETTSTLAKKRKSLPRSSLEPPGGATSPMLQGLSASRSVPLSSSQYSGWPHVPANTLPASGLGAAPNTAEVMRRRGAGSDTLYAPSIEVPVPSSAPTLQAPIVSGPSLPLSVAPPVATRAGRVVRFERMTPGQAPPPIEVLADGSPATDAADPVEDQGLVTYIQLPSPVKVNIKLPGS